MKENPTDKASSLALLKLVNLFLKFRRSHLHTRKTRNAFSVIKLRYFSVGDEPSEYLRKRRLVSTIETSPSRSLLEHSTVTSISGHGYVGYCTIRNGMPLHEFPNLSTKQKNVSYITDIIIYKFLDIL